MFVEIAFFFSFLFDLYTLSGYGRILDILVFSFLPLYVALKNVSSRVGIIYFREFIIWSIIFAISCQSLFSRDYRSFFTIGAFIGGFITYLSLRFIRYIPDLKFVKKVGFFIVFVEFIEAILYYGFDYNLNFTQYFGGISNRALNSNISIFRPSSIYQEPNQLSIALFFIMTLIILVPEKRLLENKPKNLDFKYADNEIPLNRDILQFIRNNIQNNFIFLLVICFAMLFSSSLWGIIISIICLIPLSILALFRRRNLNKSIYSFLIFSGLSIYGFVNILNILNIKVFRNTYVELTIKRLSNLAIDPSSVQRYAIGSLPEKINSISLKEFLIGNGASTTGDQDSFQNLLGANGYSFLLYSVGVIGIFLFLSIIFTALARYRNKSFANFLKMYFLIIVFFGILISTYPFFTYAVFWIWLAVALNCAHFYLGRSQ